jgi:hypothetical protein
MKKILAIAALLVGCGQNNCGAKAPETNPPVTTIPDAGPKESAKISWMTPIEIIDLGSSDACVMGYFPDIIDGTPETEKELFSEDFISIVSKNFYSVKMPLNVGNYEQAMSEFNIKKLPAFIFAKSNSNTLYQVEGEFKSNGVVMTLESLTQEGKLFAKCSSFKENN